METKQKEDSKNFDTQTLREALIEGDVYDKAKDSGHIAAVIDPYQINEEVLDQEFRTHIIRSDKKSELKEELEMFSDILMHECSYKINVEEALEKIWNLTKADFFGSKERIRIHYQKTGITFPVLFRGEIKRNGIIDTFHNYFVLAPVLPTD